MGRSLLPELAGTTAISTIVMPEAVLGPLSLCMGSDSEIGLLRTKCGSPHAIRWVGAFPRVLSRLRGLRECRNDAVPS